MNDNVPYGFIYKTILPDGRYYIGQHKIRCHNTLDPDYLGSGKLLTRYIKKHGRQGIIRLILEFAESAESLNIMEKKYVTSEILLDSLNINLCAGGAIDDPAIFREMSMTMSMLRNTYPENWPSRAGCVNNKSKRWKITSPDGIEYIVYGGLRGFCDEHKLSYNTMSSAYRQGWIPHQGSCAGWQIIDIDSGAGTTRQTSNRGEGRSGKNNPMFGKRQSLMGRKSISEAHKHNTVNSRCYLVISPNNENIILNGSMTKFNTTYGLHRTFICRISSTGKSCRGWSAVKINDKLFSIDELKQYMIDNQMNIHDYVIFT